ncbi:MAG TPA: type II secretion system protein GspG [Archangium sp.]|jgi:general secretion pathway protein G|uniref:type II secretion system protein GspG n=1 Tax=Archangium sp. TaxID=1872627 RepID=UPI002ED8BD52
MAHVKPRHPKLTAKAFLRDLLFTLGVCLAIVLWAAVLWAGALWPSHVVYISCSKQDFARQDLANLQNALKLYHSRHQRFPSTEEGMREFVKRQLLDQVPIDPWGRPYGYELHEGHPRVWSLGADGAPGGEDVDADLFLEQR